MLDNPALFAHAAEEAAASRKALRRQLKKAKAAKADALEYPEGSKERKAAPKVVPIRAALNAVPDLTVPEKMPPTSQTAMAEEYLRIADELGALSRVCRS